MFNKRRVAKKVEQQTDGQYKRSSEKQNKIQIW